MTQCIYEYMHSGIGVYIQKDTHIWNISECLSLLSILHHAAKPISIISLTCTRGGSVPHEKMGPLIGPNASL